MSDKDFWHKNDNATPNVIGIFGNDLMYGRVFSVTHSGVKTFDYTIEWDI